MLAWPPRPSTGTPFAFNMSSHTIFLALLSWATELYMKQKNMSVCLHCTWRYESDFTLKIYRTGFVARSTAALNREIMQKVLVGPQHLDASKGKCSRCNNKATRPWTEYRKRICFVQSALTLAVDGGRRWGAGDENTGYAKWLIFSTGRKNSKKRVVLL